MSHLVRYVAIIYFMVKVYPKIGWEGLGLFGILLFTTECQGAYLARLMRSLFNLTGVIKKMTSNKEASRMIDEAINSVSKKVE